MFRISLCQKIIELHNSYDYVEKLCCDYIYRGPAASDLSVRVTPSEIESYRTKLGRYMTDGEAESYLLYREICGKMPAFGICLLHASAVMVEDARGRIRGYAFSARRGVGKSTHTELWEKCFAGSEYPKVTVINGDKPLIQKCSDGTYKMWGTPWCGKEGKQKNTSCPLNAICFLEQGKDNQITKSDIADTAARLLEATLLPPTSQLQDAMATLVGATVRDIPAFILSCRPDVWAVRMAYDTLSNL